MEFLRINHWIESWFGVDYSRYTLKEGGYRHLPLDEKRRILRKITIPNVTVCEDVLKHYVFWSRHVNPNPDDCCNLRLGGYDAIQPKDPMQTPGMSESCAGRKEVL